jgi:DNA-binding CsgD family transcriptional regulator
MLAEKIDYLTDHSFKDLLQKRALPGVLVVELSGKVAFASPEAADFLEETVPKMKHNGSTHSVHTLPEQILNFCREASRSMPQNGHAQKSPPRQGMIYRSPAEHYYLVIALSLGRGATPNDRKLILVVQRVGQRKSVNPEQLGKVYGLTKREQEVVTRLVRGDSNKEIAASLKIQEYTVKDHLKHIMAKCQVDSRLSIISRMLNL